MATGLPGALCRLVTVSTTPPEQRLQCMAMLRVLIHDPATHQLMIENKAGRVGGGVGGQGSAGRAGKGRKGTGMIFSLLL